MSDSTSTHTRPNEANSGSNGGVFKNVQDNIRERRKSSMQILPKNDGEKRSLLAVVAVMCYLATLAGAGVIGIQAATDRWTTGLTSTVTIKLKPQYDLRPGDEGFETSRIGLVMAVISEQSGVRKVNLIERDVSNQLLEPWLDPDIIPDTLPIPDLIDIQIDPLALPDLEALETRVREIDDSAELDDHMRWNDRILSFANIIHLVAVFILIIISLTTVVIVIFATRALLSARQEVVEVMHLIGARDAAIANEFQKSFLVTGLQGGVLGMAGAIATIAAVAALSDNVSGVSSASLLPPIQLDFWALAPIYAVPFVAAAITTLTARATVMQVIKNTMY